MNRKPSSYFPAILGLVMLALPAKAQSNACVNTLSADAQTIVNDLSAIAAQGNAQGVPQAVQNLAKALQEIIPTLSVPDQQTVEKFLTDLSAATSSSGPGGSSITPSEKLVLTNDVNKIFVSSGLTTSQINTLTNDILAVMTSVSGISTVQLQADVQKTTADLKSCKVR